MRQGVKPACGSKNVAKAQQQAAFAFVKAEAPVSSARMQAVQPAAKRDTLKAVRTEFDARMTPR